jgi:hypothetical protein
MPTPHYHALLVQALGAVVLGLMFGLVVAVTFGPPVLALIHSWGP